MWAACWVYWWLFGDFDRLFLIENHCICLGQKAKPLVWVCMRDLLIYIAWALFLCTTLLRSILMYRRWFRVSGSNKSRKLFILTIRINNNGKLIIKIIRLLCSCSPFQSLFNKALKTRKSFSTNSRESLNTLKFATVKVLVDSTLAHLLKRRKTSTSLKLATTCSKVSTILL